MLNKIDHLGVAVRSIEDRLGFWSGLGLGEPHLEEVASEQVRVAMLQVGESKIELLEPTTDDSVIAKFMDTRGEGIHHVCFAVADIEAEIAALQEAGARLVGEAPRVGAGGCRVAFVHPKSSGGLLIELKEERPRPTLARKRIGPGSIVLMHLGDPPQKYWGMLDEMTPMGVQIRGLELGMVVQWAREIARGEEVALGLSHVFFPLSRVEKIFLDEDVGVVQSVKSGFEQIVGRAAEEFF